MTNSFDLDWDLVPLGGETNQSYKGIKNDQHIFLKRNTTPFLAAVSVEGIAPKLLWTKRTAHGEGITAQEWLNARELKAVEMVQHDVLTIVKYIHSSQNLKNMLLKIQGDAVLPYHFLNEYLENLQHELKNNHFLNGVVSYLHQTSGHIENCPKTVCHGDLNHRNFLLDQSNRLYIVDWELVRLADPLSDVATLLVNYVARKDWLVWLQAYGFELTYETLQRLEWYCLWTCLMNVKRNHFQGRNHAMNHAILMIKNLIGKDKLC